MLMRFNRKGKYDMKKLIVILFLAALIMGICDGGNITAAIVIALFFGERVVKKNEK